MRRFAAVLALSVVTFAGVAYADPDAPAGNPVAAPPSTGAAKSTKPVHDASWSSTVVCKSQETTGSRLGGKRVCMTRAEWEEQSAEHKRVYQDEMLKGTLAGAPGH
jgi:hypothetical protein